MKKILINFLGRNSSGPVFSFEIAKAFAHNGYEVYVILSEYITNKVDWENEEHIKEIFYLKTYRSLKELIFNSFNYVIRDVNNVNIHYNSFYFDILLTTFVHPWNEEIISSINAKHKIYICHDPKPHSGENVLISIANQRQVKKSQEIIILTQKFRELLVTRYGKKKKDIYYIPHGLMGKYKTSQNKKKKIVYDKNKYNFLFFGRIEKYKGIRILLEAYEMLYNNNFNVSLTIAGKGDLGPYRKKISILNNINIVNEYIADEDVANYFDDESVITVLPYIDSSQSGVIPIAVEFGTPIISSDTEGLKEQLDNGNVGMFFETGNSNDLMKKMLLMMDKRKMHEQKEQLKKLLNKLNWNVIVEHLITQIEENDRKEF